MCRVKSDQPTLFALNRGPEQESCAMFLLWYTISKYINGKGLMRA